MEAAGEEDEDIEAPPIDTEASSKNLAPGDPKGIITGNGAHLLTPDILALYTPMARLLSLDALTVSALETSELLATLDGRTFLHYAVKCALPAGATLQAKFLGNPYTFKGFIGLAPEWTSQALSESSRRWLSACLFAHVNAAAAQVPILLRGDHPALSTPLAGGSGAAFTLREGAFYGDIFELVPAKHACPGEGSLPVRMCTDDVAGLSPCGFTVLGECLGTESVCDGEEEGAYETCHGGLSLTELPTVAYPETITVYLAP